MAYTPHVLNQKRSYTEYNVTTPTAVFAVGFKFFDYRDNLNVTLNGIDITTVGYNFVLSASDVVTVNPPIEAGILRISRETGVDKNVHAFSSGAIFNATNMDENFEQIRHSQQEVRDDFEFLEYNVLSVVEAARDAAELANDATDLANDAAQEAYDAAAQVNDKISYQDLNDAIAATQHNSMQGRDTAEAHPASAISDASGKTQQQINDAQTIKNTYVLDLRDFGYIGDDVLHPLSEQFASLASAQAVYPSATSLADSIDTVVVQKAIDYCKSQGKTTKIAVPSGKSIHNKEIVWKTYAYFEGVSYHDTVFQKATGFNGRLIVSENFDSITGTNASLTGLPITDFGIDKIKLDGQYIVNDQYVNNFGKGNLFIYGTKYKLDVKSINTDGVGVWLEYTGNEDFVNDVIRDADINLTIYDTAHEGLIFKGAPDIVLSKVIQKGAGKITSTDARNFTLWSSPNFPVLGRIDGVVFTQGAEIGLIHAFGNAVGYGIRFETGRINAELLISESVLGGIDFYAPVYGLIDKIQVHNVKGGVTYVDPPHASAGTFANLDIKSTSGLVIGEVRSDHSGGGQTGQNHVRFKGFQASIGTLRINAFGKSGHGVYFDTGSFGNVVNNLIFNNASGNSGFDGALTAAVVRNSDFASRQNFINSGQIVTCPVGLRTIGVNPRIEKIELQGSNVTTPFEGVQKSNHGQRWNIDLADTTNTVKSTQFAGVATFDPTILTHQELTIPHNLIYAPDIKAIQVSIVDTFTGLSSTAEVQYLYVSAISATEIKVAVQMKVASGSNTTPYVTVHASI